MKRKFFVFILLSASLVLMAVDNQVIWDINNLTSIGGCPITIYGSPTVISTSDGDAVEFDGIDDRIQILANPLSVATEFTIEVVFNPYDSPTSIEPRFLHIEDSLRVNNKRITIECRFNGRGGWYSDTFIKAPLSNKSLIDSISEGFHYTNVWTHIALTYKDGVMKSYVNGKPALSGLVNYEGLASNAQVSLGGRMNNLNYLKGAIRKVIITPTALLPGEFTYNGVSPEIVSVNETESFTLLFLLNDELINPNNLETHVYSTTGAEVLTSSKSVILVKDLRSGVYIAKTKLGILKFIK